MYSVSPVAKLPGLLIPITYPGYTSLFNRSLVRSKQCLCLSQCVVLIGFALTVAHIDAFAIRVWHYCYITGWAPISENLTKNSSMPKLVMAVQKNKGLYVPAINRSISRRLISPSSNSASSNNFSYNASSLICSFSLPLFSKSTFLTVPFVWAAWLWCISEL